MKSKGRTHKGLGLLTACARDVVKYSTTKAYRARDLTRNADIGNPAAGVTAPTTTTSSRTYQDDCGYQGNATDSARSAPVQNARAGSVEGHHGRGTGFHSADRSASTAPGKPSMTAYELIQGGYDGPPVPPNLAPSLPNPKGVKHGLR